jgi:hypothetical protein
MSVYLSDPFITHLDELKTDTRKITNHIYDLSHIYLTVDRLGLTDSTLSSIRSSRLLSSTAIETIATESLSSRSDNGTASEIALESIKEAIKIKITQWSAKILSVVKSTIDKLTNITAPIFSKIKEKMSGLRKGTYNALKASKDVIKTHPYKTATAAIASILVVAGIIAYATGHFPKSGSSASVVDSYYTRLKTMINGIKSPVGTIKADISKTTGLTISSMTHPVDPVSGTAVDLGWTKSATDSFINNTQSMMDSMSSSWKSFESTSIATSKSMESNINSLLGRESYDDFDEGPTVVETIVKIAKAIYYIVKALVVICLSIISSVFGVIGHIYDNTSIKGLR